MRQRGRILRDANAGPGLVAVGGKQLAFELEGVWRADVAPKPNMVVEVDTDESGTVTAIHAVDEGQLAREQAEAALGSAKDMGLKMYNNLSVSLGKPVLAALAVLAISWLFLAAISVRVTASVEQSITFWDLLKLLNAGGGLTSLGSAGNSTGIYGFLCLAALGGPFYAKFWKQPFAHLGMVLPLALMLLVAGRIYFGLQDGVTAAGQVAGQFGGQMASDMVRSMVAEIMKAVSIGLGAYLALGASCYLGFSGLRRYLAAKASA